MSLVSKIEQVFDWIALQRPSMVLCALFCLVGAAIIALVSNPKDTPSDQPISEEIRTVAAVGYGIDVKVGRYFLRLRDADGDEMDFTISAQEASRCAVGQKVVVVMQGIDQRLHEEACDKKTLAGT